MGNVRAGGYIYREPCNPRSADNQGSDRRGTFHTSPGSHSKERFVPRLGDYRCDPGTGLGQDWTSSKAKIVTSEPSSCRTLWNLSYARPPCGRALIAKVRCNPRTDPRRFEAALR